MKNCQLSVLGVVALILSTGQHVYAHPGHGLGDHGVAHVVSSPFHVAALLAVALGCWGAAWFVSHTLGRRLLRFGAVAAFFGAAVAWSVMT